MCLLTKCSGLYGERQRTNRKVYTTCPGVKVEGSMTESTKVDIAVEELQRTSVNIDTLKSNHEVCLYSSTKV